MAQKTSITFYGGVGSVTGANFLLDFRGLRILVDCGMFQGTPASEAENINGFPYDPKTIDYLFITHAHMDHIGRVPKLISAGFSGIIYGTPETKAIASLMLEDAVKVFSRNNAGSEILYTIEDVKKSFEFWKEIAYHTPVALENNIEVIAKDAGHILGSAMYEFTIGGKKIVFTGDLGNSPAPLLRDTETITDASYLIMESVYGDRNHEPPEERRRKLQEAILDTIKRQAVLIIPAFSLERTQVMLSELNFLVEHDLIPAIPVFVDSPLAIKVTEIYRSMRKNFNQSAKETIASGDEIFSFPKLHFTLHKEDSQDIREVRNPKIIIAGGGMSNGGRIIHHEKLYLPDPKTILLLVGYQALGTLGRELQNGSKEVFIDGEKIPVRADIRVINGYSSHKDSDHLVSFVEATAETLKKVFVVMGEPKASLYLVQRLRDYLDVEAIYPKRGEPYVLEI